MQGFWAGSGGKRRDDRIDVSGFCRHCPNGQNVTCRRASRRNEKRHKSLSLWRLGEPPQGFEPWTPALRKRCTTTVLRWLEKQEFQCVSRVRLVFNPTQSTRSYPQHPLDTPKAPCDFSGSGHNTRFSRNGCHIQERFYTQRVRRQAEQPVLRRVV
jgi:hypothetical protein